MEPMPTGTQVPRDNEDDSKRAQDEQMRRDLLATILDAAARERLSRIALVSLERAKKIEGILLRMAQAGQLRGQVSERQLIELLDQMENFGTGVGSKKSTIVFQRRKDFDDDDFDI